jgi:hypothetical protein
MRVLQRGKILQPEVLPDLQRKGPVRQRSLSADLIYSLVVCFFKVFMRSLRLVFASFLSRKKKKASAAKSGASQARWDSPSDKTTYRTTGFFVPTTSFFGTKKVIFTVYWITATYTIFTAKSPYE